ncbi:UNVERIFIED_CONTAM: hypothetical protein FKN15_059976 [Acipenser sinensis]
MVERSGPPPPPGPCLCWGSHLLLLPSAGAVAQSQPVKGEKREKTDWDATPFELQGGGHALHRTDRYWIHHTGSSSRCSYDMVQVAAPCVMK